MTALLTLAAFLVFVIAVRQALIAPSSKTWEPATWAAVAWFAFCVLAFSFAFFF